MKILMRTWICLVFLCLFFNSAQAEQEKKTSIIKVMVNEQIFADNSTIYDYYGNQKDILNIWTSISQADTTLMGVLLENGFKVLGNRPNTTKGNVAKQDILRATEGDDFTSTNLGDYLRADIVIVGKTVARGVSALKNSSQKSARANINIRAIKVANGEIIAVESASATAVAIDEISAGVEAIKAATRSAAKNLVKKISSIK